ncbi:MAG: hypothetical protein ACREVA_11485 [Burkholderiales bacterium]
MSTFLRLLDRPIAFHRCFIDLTGSVTAALFLSQAVYWQKRIPDKPDGWWYKTRTQWSEETGLSRYEQETARQRLRDAGILLEERRGMPAKIWYRIDQPALRNLLSNARGYQKSVDNRDASKPIDELNDDEASPIDQFVGRQNAAIVQSDRYRPPIENRPEEVESLETNKIDRWVDSPILSPVGGNPSIKMVGNPPALL